MDTNEAAHKAVSSQDEAIMITFAPETVSPSKKEKRKKRLVGLDNPQFAEEASPKTTKSGLRRQPTVYPHGLSISVETVKQEEQVLQKESVSSTVTLRIDSDQCLPSPNEQFEPTELTTSAQAETFDAGFRRHFHNKNVIDSDLTPEQLTELQLRRYKYPSTGNYYLEQQDAAKTPPYKPSLTEQTQRYCNLRSLRYLVCFMTGLLMLAGLLSYCISLHGAVKSENFLMQPVFQLEDDFAGYANGTELFSNVITTGPTVANSKGTNMTYKYGAITGDTSTTTARAPFMHESTILRAVNTRSNIRQQPPKEQRLKTYGYKNDMDEFYFWPKENDKKEQEFRGKLTDDTASPENYDYDTSIDATDENIEFAREVAAKVKDATDYSNAAATADKAATVKAAVAAIRDAFHAQIEKHMNMNHKYGIMRFTSGHQNSFGVPIEEDQRHMDYKPRSPALTTPGAMTRVSPTIPSYIHRSRPSVGVLNPLQDNGCLSTSLTVCQGVMDYDLTYPNVTRRQELDGLSAFAFHELIKANCSKRTLEFICVLLEPECRPSHIGQLQPCRRFCKAVYEPCSIVISASNVLSEVFDCDQYPDSHDLRKCEDPTRRRGYCYHDEFECFDRTCIPKQWLCDNIKDCADGEDESECVFCEPDEFRCESNEKCIPETSRCDKIYDCFDGTDEQNCDELLNGSGGGYEFDFLDGKEENDNIFPHIFSYASYLLPRENLSAAYNRVAIASVDDNDKEEQSRMFKYVKALTMSITANAKDYANANDENNDDDHGDADVTGNNFDMGDILLNSSLAEISNETVTNTVPGDGPKGFVNFRDSKEIMMTSDSENNFKYSAAAAARGNRTFANSTIGGLINQTTKSSLTTSSPTPSYKPAASTRYTVITESPVYAPCTIDELRCISGKCIKPAQLCDKIIDCPDGADELMCVYKERKSPSSRKKTTPTTTTTTTTIAPKNSTEAAVTTVPTPRSEKRTIRTTTIKRKVKN